MKISSVTVPAFTLPGQRTIAGVRMPPSKPDPKWPRHGPFEPPIDVRSSRRVVAVPDDDGVVGDAGLIDRVEHLAGAVVQLGERVRVDAAAGLALEVRMRNQRRMHLREADVGEERLAGLRRCA